MQPAKESPLVPSIVVLQSNSSAKVTRGWKAEKRSAVMEIASLTVLGVGYFSNIGRIKNMMKSTAVAMVGIKGSKIWKF